MTLPFASHSICKVALRLTPLQSGTPGIKSLLVLSDNNTSLADHDFQRTARYSSDRRLSFPMVARLSLFPPPLFLFCCEEGAH